MTPRDEMEAALEAILFVSAEPVQRERLLELFDEGEAEAATAALEAVLERYRGRPGRGVMVDEVAGGVRLVTRPELGGWLRRFYEVRGGHKLSMPALETLAIVAYRQPITAPEIQELRGVSPSGVLKTLLERRLVRIAGRKPVVGNPFLYRTTREFLAHFGLDDLRQLPPLEEFEEAFGGGGAEGLLAAGDDEEEAVLARVAELDEAADDAADRRADDEDGEAPEDGTGIGDDGEEHDEQPAAELAEASAR